MKTYTSSEMAKLIGVTQHTIQVWDNEKKLIAHRTPGNHRYYTQNDVDNYFGINKYKKTNSKSKIYLYARVSSRSQIPDLKYQVNYLKMYAAGKGYQVDKVITEQGSGMNYKRKHWNQLIKQALNHEHITVIVTYPDRFIRFGFKWFEQLFQDYGSKIEVVNKEPLSANQELVQDLISIIQVFSSKLYGLRSYKRQLKVDDKNGKFK